MVAAAVNEGVERVKKHVDERLDAQMKTSADNFNALGSFLLQQMGNLER